MQSVNMDNDNIIEFDLSRKKSKAYYAQQLKKIALLRKKEREERMRKAQNQRVIDEYKLKKATPPIPIK